MTFSDAIMQLTPGKAAKPSNWGGYLAKVRTGTAPEWSDTAAYSVGAFCTHDYETYICVSQIAAPTEGEHNVWDPAKWERCEPAYVLRFQERTGSTTYAFTYTPSVSGGAVIWTVTAPTPALEVDAALFQAFYSTDWNIGTIESFESVRTGTGRW